MRGRWCVALAAVGLQSATSIAAPVCWDVATAGEWNDAPESYAFPYMVEWGPPGPASFQEIVFREEFDRPDDLRDNGQWVIGHPEDGDGWWVQGRTFFPNPDQHPSAPFPRVEDGACVIEHRQYNPFDHAAEKWTFLGGEIHTKMTFDPNRCYRFEARVRWPQPPAIPGGLVSSFFTYGYDLQHAESDEIDFEFLSSQVFDLPHLVLTNTWNDSRRDAPRQKALSVPIPELDLTQWQIFRFYWYPGRRVSWTWVDPAGNECWLRSETEVTFLPDEPMSLYFNFWAPCYTGHPRCEEFWDDAADENLQPDQQENNVKYEYWIDRVEVRASNRADFDCDGDVDADDLAALTVCATGARVPVAPGCGPKDLDGDGDADLDDFGRWQRCYSGAGRPAEPACAD